MGKNREIYNCDTDLLNAMQTQMYMADVETYDLVLVNNSLVGLFGGNYEGKKCYEYLEKRDTPCENCRIPLLKKIAAGTAKPSDFKKLNAMEINDGIVETTHFHTITQIYFLNNDRLINFQGRLTLLNESFNISIREKQRQELEFSVEADKVMSDCFQMLFYSINVRKTVNVVLEKLGRFLDADRAYDFVINDDNTASIDYEWCKEGVSSDIDKFQKVPYSEIATWTKPFLEHEAIIVPDIEAIKDERPEEYAFMNGCVLTSYVELPIEISGRLVGFIGFDNPNPEKILSMRSLFVSLTYAITNSLLDQERREALQKQNAELTNMIENIPIGICVYKMVEGAICCVATNDTFSEMIGKPAVSIVGETFEDLSKRLHPEDRERCAKVTVDGLMQKKKASGDFRTYSFKKKEYFWVHLEARLVGVGEEGLAYFTFSDISAQKEAENALIDSQRRYKIAIEGAEMTAWEYDLNKQVIYVESKELADMGYNGKIPNMPEAGFKVVDERSHDEYRRMLKELDEDVSGGRYDLWYHSRKDGKYRCHRFIFAVFYNEDRTSKKAYGLSFDVTTQKAELARYEKTINEITMENPNMIGVFHLNISKDICVDGISSRQAVSDLAKPGTVDAFIYGLAKFFLVEKERQVFIDTCNCKALEQRFNSGEDKITFSFRSATYDGKALWVESHINMTLNPETGDIEAVAYSVDQNVESIRNNILQKMTTEEFELVGVINVKDLRVNFYSYNAEIMDEAVNVSSNYSDIILAYCKNNIDDEFKDDLLRHCAIANIIEKLEDSEFYTVTVAAHNDAGKHFRKILKYSYLDETKEVILVTRTDVTRAFINEQAANRKLMEALEEARAANQAKSDFLSRISHDIRTPMNVISGMTTFAMEDADNKDKLLEDLREIEVANTFLLSLINDILDLSKIESGRMELHDGVYLLDDFMANINGMFVPLCDAQHLDLNVKCESSTNAIIVDSVRLNQVILNILSNAVKYTKSGGYIDFTVKGEENIEGYVDGTFIVKDSGIGMSEEFQKTMFDSFTQSDENVSRELYARGTGLGLAIVKKIVDMMGGTIEVESKLNIGTTMTIKMRFRVATPEEVKTYESEKDRGGSGDLEYNRILVVEDHPMNAEIMERILLDRGIQSEIAKNGQEGVQMFQKSVPGYYDAILMDIQMPVMNGYEATMEIRALNRPDATSIPIVAMTANAFSEDVAKSLSVGMNDHVSKPIDPNDLFHKLSRIADMKKNNLT